MTSPVRAVVVGCGDISAVHLAALRDLDGVELVGVCDVDGDRAAAAAAARDVPAYTDHREMLAALEPEVAHVCTPHDQHTLVAVDCIERGVHVVLEKPVAHTLAEAQKVLDASPAKPATKVAVCFQNRYNRASQEAHRLLRSGALGEVRGASATVAWHRTPEYYARSPWRGERRQSGGGVLMNQAIHTLDLLQWFLGPVSQVGSRIGTLALGDYVDVEDTAQLVMDHETGSRSVLFATVVNSTDAPVTIEIDTERAHLLIRGDLTVTFADGRTQVVEERRATPTGRTYWGVSHELLVADFYRTLEDPETFWIGPAEGMASLAVLDQVYRDAYGDSLVST
ncbi:MAG: Gfo/Idh/MocA family oxidoreductase [Lapillicoccus sp.]